MQNTNFHLYKSNTFYNYNYHKLYSVFLLVQQKLPGPNAKIYLCTAKLTLKYLFS
jgi:hypothetical protein